MFKKIVDMLIDTGIMEHFAKNYYTKKLKFESYVDSPKVLFVKDLTFGFNIWIGFCCLSVFMFMTEIVAKKLKIRFKIRSNKVADSTNLNLRYSISV